MNKLKPAMAFHPWEYLLDELKERWLTQTDFAKMIWKPLKTINEIIKWKKSITAEMALIFEVSLWISSETWLWLQKTYELSIAKNKFSEKEFLLKKTIKEFLKNKTEINTNFFTKFA